MTEAGSPKLLFENVDFTPIQPILWTCLHKHGPGRPVEYNPEWDLKALMLRQLEQIPYIKDLVKRLRRNPYLRRVCGYGDRSPCDAHFTQMKKRVGAEGFRPIEAWLRREALRHRSSQPLSSAGLIQAACVDGTDLQAWSSRDPPRHKTRPRRPGCTGGQRQERLLAWLSEPVPRGHRGFPAGPRGGIAQREREAARRQPPRVS